MVGKKKKKNVQSEDIKKKESPAWELSAQDTSPFYPVGTAPRGGEQHNLSLEQHQNPLFAGVVPHLHHYDTVKVFILCPSPSRAAMRRVTARL